MLTDVLNYSFPNNIASLTKTVFAGSFVPYRECPIKRAALDIIESKRKYPNPDGTLLLDEFFFLVKPILGSIDINGLKHLPWSNRPFKKNEFFKIMVAFADQHNEKVDSSLFAPHRAKQYTDCVIEKADSLNRQVTLPEQFSIALELAESHILGAAVIAHSGSRAIARGGDSRIHGSCYDVDDVLKWQNSVSTFENQLNTYGDPPGDTYHFWGGFVAGLVGNHIFESQDRILNPVYQWIYLHTAEATEIVRTRIAHNPSETHKVADVLGYTLGACIGNTIT